MTDPEVPLTYEEICESYCALCLVSLTGGSPCEIHEQDEAP